MKKIKEFYKLIPDAQNPEAWTVQIIKGSWKDISYRYGEVSFVEEEPSLRCKFDTDIISVPDEFRGKKYTEEEEVEFKNLLGEVLIDIINANIKNIKDGKISIG